MTTPCKPGRRILIVDDDQMVSHTLMRLLAVDGHTAEIVKSGFEALAAFEPGRFDLIITDYEMPDMKGDQLAAQIKARAPGQKIIILTAWEEKLKSQGRPVAADLIIGKPFQLREFREALNKILNS